MKNQILALLIATISVVFIVISSSLHSALASNPFDPSNPFDKCRLFPEQCGIKFDPCTSDPNCCPACNALIVPVSVVFPNWPIFLPLINLNQTITLTTLANQSVAVISGPTDQVLNKDLSNTLNNIGNKATLAASFPRPEPVINNTARISP